MLGQRRGRRGYRTQAEQREKESKGVGWTIMGKPIMLDKLKTRRELKEFHQTTKGGEV